MQYNGFISTLIERSEEILRPERGGDLEVTKILLVLSAGFALARDRIRYWDDHDYWRARQNNAWKELKKAGRSRLDTQIFLEKQTVFERFRTCGDWSYFRVEHDERRGPLSPERVLKLLRKAEERKTAQLKLDDIVWALRNSFAHGGVVPMSPMQAGQRKAGSRNTIGRDDHIDRVYFVSKWTGDSPQDHIGWIIMEFGIDSLYTFWEDWKEFLLCDGTRSIKDLDYVA